MISSCVTLITKGTTTTTTTTSITTANASTGWSAQHLLIQSDHQRDSNYYSYSMINNQLRTNTTTIAASIWWSVSVPTSQWSQQWVANTAAGRRRCVRNFPHSCVLANLICAKVGNCVCIKRVGLSHKKLWIFHRYLQIQLFRRYSSIVKNHRLW